MNLLKKVLEKLIGLRYRQEYLCLADEQFPDRLNLYLMKDGKVIKDVSQLHSFVGYSPVVFVFPSFPELVKLETIDIIFSKETFTINSSHERRSTVACMSLKKIVSLATTSGDLFFFEAKNASHRFIPRYRQWAAQVYNRLYNNKPGNVFLKGNLYQQVQVAYSFPRKVCLISVGAEGSFNLFPTDLHGPAGESYYVISLRHAGKACAQVMENRRLVLSEMEVTYFKTIYSLGKNHMQPLKEATAFDFSPSVSKVFQLPLPKGVMAYKELLLQDSFTHGIHRLLIFRVISSASVNPGNNTLAHVHNAYATWRNKEGQPSNYFLR